MSETMPDQMAFSWKKIKAHERALIRDVVTAHKEGQRKKADYAGRMYIKSFAPRLIAVRSAVQALRSDLRPPMGMMAEIAGNLNAWAGTDESVIVHFKPKARNPDEFRPIMDFGIENRALQHLIIPVLKARADLHPDQYGTQGGTHAAINRISKALVDGYDWVVETDIKDCYPSFDEEKVPDMLPVPKEVARKVALSRYLALSPGNIKKWIGPDDGVGDDYEPLANAIAEARRGIPQGSAVSPLVAEVLLELAWEIRTGQ